MPRLFRSLGLLCALLLLLADPAGSLLPAQEPSTELPRAGEPLRGESPKQIGPAEPASAAGPDDASQPMISVQLWVVTAVTSRAQPNDDLAVDLAQSLMNLPTPLDSREAVENLLARLAAGDALRRSRLFRLTTIAGQTAMSSTGATRPQVTGTQRTQTGRVNNIVYRPVGTIAKVLPTLAANGQIHIAIEYSSSEMMPDPNLIIADFDPEPPIHADVITSRELSMTVRLHSGTAVVLECRSSTEPKEEAAVTEIELLILSAEVMPNE